jgi:hypothetical protein
MRGGVLALLLAHGASVRSLTAGATAQTLAAARTLAARSSVITAQIRVGPYEHLRTASMDECMMAAPFFCDQLQRPEEMDIEIQRGLEALLASPNGARSFFFAWNTDPDFAAADESPPPAPLLAALDESCQAPGPTRFFAQALLMNIAMPAAAAAAAEGDAAREAAAMRSYKRAALLGGFISACKGGAASLPGTLRAESEAFGAALEAERGGGANSAEEAFAHWADAIAAGGYDAKQLEAVAQAIRLSGPGGQPQATSAPSSQGVSLAQAWYEADTLVSWYDFGIRLRPEEAAAATAAAEAAVAEAARRSTGQ